MKKVKINKTDFKKLSKWSESVYNVAVVADYFCSPQQEIEELYNLTPVIKALRQQSDEITFFPWTFYTAATFYRVLFEFYYIYSNFI